MKVGSQSLHLGEGGSGVWEDISRLRLGVLWKQVCDAHILSAPGPLGLCLPSLPLKQCKAHAQQTNKSQMKREGKSRSGRTERGITLQSAPFLTVSVPAEGILFTPQAPGPGPWVPRGQAGPGPVNSSSGEESSPCAFFASPRTLISSVLWQDICLPTCWLRSLQKPGPSANGHFHWKPLKTLGVVPTSCKPHESGKLLSAVSRSDSTGTSYTWAPFTLQLRPEVQVLSTSTTKASWLYFQNNILSQSPSPCISHPGPLSHFPDSTFTLQRAIYWSAGRSDQPHHICKSKFLTLAYKVLSDVTPDLRPLLPPLPISAWVLLVPQTAMAMPFSDLFTQSAHHIQELTACYSGLSSALSREELSLYKSNFRQPISHWATTVDSMRPQELCHETSLSDLPWLGPRMARSALISLGMEPLQTTLGKFGS
jgi:hypothetical protein